MSLTDLWLSFWCMQILLCDSWYRPRYLPAAYPDLWLHLWPRQKSTCLDPSPAQLCHLSALLELHLNASYCCRWVLGGSDLGIPCSKDQIPVQGLKGENQGAPWIPHLCAVLHQNLYATWRIHSPSQVSCDTLPLRGTAFSNLSLYTIALYSLCFPSSDLDSPGLN